VVLRKRKKVTKQRGKRTHGHGCAKRGRGSGEKGGKGASGKHKHLWSYVIKHEPDYFGKHGFKRHTIKEKQKEVNVGELDKRLDELVNKELVRQEGDIYKIDLGKLGFDKLLGGGKVKHKLGGKIVSGEGDGGGASEGEVQALRT